MQLAVRVIVISLLLSYSVSLAQNSEDNISSDSKPVEIDFLLSYYEQDGDHSAVTGGIGSQELDDIATIIVVNVPVNETNNLSFTLGVDVYSSASTANVNPLVSGPSDGDMRAYLNVGYSIANPASNMSYGFNVGVSTEYDYQSLNFGLNWAITSANKNREFSIGAQAFIDNVSLIYPWELRSPDQQLDDTEDINYETAGRNTYSLSLTYSQVLSKKLQALISTDFVFQSGFLSTPFHRVFFVDQELPKVEKLPDNRFKLPVGLRLNYYVSDLFITRFYYRYYYDTFGITANTFEIETPIRISSEFVVSPFYRYHNQTGADDFKGFKQHTLNDTYYTSDYDLSAFNSNKYGIAIRYYPLMGITQLFGSTVKRLDLRVAFYDRSDGLNGYNISLGTSFLLQ